MSRTVIPVLVFFLLFTGPAWAMLLTRLPERLWPAQAPRPAADRLNWLVWIAYMAAQAVTGPALGGLITLAVNQAGGGLIVLPSSGWGLILGFVIYLLAMDLAEYAFHRAQHAIPALWAMHALHHSDPHFDATTSARHFWAEPAIKSLTVWLAVGVLFKASPLILGLYTAAAYWNVPIHSNTRLSLGRFAWLLNTPAYHRMHHSASPEHWDCNFAALLPIYDVIFGGYRPPGPAERPKTGLDTGERPDGPLQAVLWPLVYLGQRRAAAARALEAAP
ncbi:MAG TPA: sterol desaturase family protein [Caulobacteraceae bacterium]|nr:sterol desaturase family protein [Caulobacteraceae bacterium]